MPGQLQFNFSPVIQKLVDQAERAEKSKRKTKAKPAARGKPRKRFWELLQEAISGSAGMLERHAYSFPRMVVSEGTYATDYRARYGEDVRKATQEAGAELLRMKELKGPARRRTDTLEQQREAEVWKEIRDAFRSRLWDYAKEPSPANARRRLQAWNDLRIHPYLETERER